MSIPTGSGSDLLAESLGFKEGSQIGGMAGGGIVKVAKKFGVDAETLYRHQVKFTVAEGREVTYYPGVTY